MKVCLSAGPRPSPLRATLQTQQLKLGPALRREDGERHGSHQQFLRHEVSGHAVSQG